MVDAKTRIIKGCEAMHWLIDEAWEVPGEELSLSFLTKVEGEQVGFETNLIYFLLHEAIYCCPSTAETTSEWAAARQLEQNSDYHWKARLTSEEPIFFTGEMVFAHMSESFKALGSLKPVANMLAHKVCLLYKCNLKHNVRHIWYPICLAGL